MVERLSSGVGSGRPDGRPVLDNYARLSWKPDTGDLEKIDDQHADNARVIERVGATVGKELSDGASAWKKGARRPGWDELISRVESGACDGVAVWDTDRLLRQPRDLDRLIDLAEAGYSSSWFSYFLSR